MNIKQDLVIMRYVYTKSIQIIPDIFLFFYKFTIYYILSD